MDEVRVCPNCYIALERDVSTNIFKCDKCNGKAITFFLLDHIFKKDVAQNIISQVKDSSYECSKNCVACQEPMQESIVIQKHKKYNVQFCKNCDYLWFEDSYFNQLRGKGLNLTNPYNLFDNQVRKKENATQDTEMSNSSFFQNIDSSQLSNQPTLIIIRPMFIFLIVLATTINFYRADSFAGDNHFGFYFFALLYIKALGYICIPGLPLFLGLGTFLTRSGSMDTKIAKMFYVGACWSFILICFFTSFQG